MDDALECPECGGDMKEDETDLFSCPFCSLIMDMRSVQRPAQVVPHLAAMEPQMPAEMPKLAQPVSPTGKALVPPKAVPVLLVVGGALTVVAEGMTDPTTYTKDGLFRLLLRVGAFLLAAVSPGLRKMVGG